MRVTHGNPHYTDAALHQESTAPAPGNPPTIKQLPDCPPGHHRTRYGCRRDLQAPRHGAGRRAHAQDAGNVSPPPVIQPTAAATTPPPFTQGWFARIGRKLQRT